MDAQLEAIVGEFEQVSVRLHRLAQATTEERWAARPAAGRWSAAECVAHLTLTTQAFRPHIEKALEEARVLREARTASAPRRRHRRGVIGSLLFWALSKPGRFATKTGAAFVPTGVEPRDRALAEFDRLQDEQIGWVRAADGLPLDEVNLPSPFNARVRYNLFAALSILARHQQRHLAQAEDAVNALSPSSRSS